MTVYFSAKAQDILERVEVYRKIIQTIYESGHVLAHGWVEVAAQRAIRLRKEDKEWAHDWITLCAEAESAIRHSDALIAETTGPSTMGVGHQIALALQLKKPVLALVDEAEVYGSYIQGIKSEFLTVEGYNRQNLHKIIEDFLARQMLLAASSSLRLKIDIKTRKRLAERAASMGKSESDLAVSVLKDNI